MSCCLVILLLLIIMCLGVCINNKPSLSVFLDFIDFLSRLHCSNSPGIELGWLIWKIEVRLIQELGAKCI